MSEPMIPLSFDHIQRASLTAHLLTYLFSRVGKPYATRQERIAEAVHEVTYRLLHLPEEGTRTIVPLSHTEWQSIRYALLILKPLYEQWPDAPSAPIALEHLAACLALLDQAVRQTHARTRNQEREELPGELFRE